MVNCNLVEITFVTENSSAATEICKSLVAKHLVASTHCFKVKSNFIWDNKEESIDEYKVNCLTLKSNLNKIEEVIKGIHSYEVFQITAIAITECNEDFREWAYGMLNA